LDSLQGIETLTIGADQLIQIARLERWLGQPSLLQAANVHHVIIGKDVGDPGLPQQTSEVGRIWYLRWA